jgi:hypothetical protein
MAAACAVLVHWAYWIDVGLSALLMVIYCTPRREQ